MSRHTWIQPPFLLNLIVLLIFLLLIHIHPNINPRSLLYQFQLFLWTDLPFSLLPLVSYLQTSCDCLTPPDYTSLDMPIHQIQSSPALYLILTHCLHTPTLR